MANTNNPFKLLNNEEELPKKHREYVLSSIDTARFLMEFAELFTFTQVETNGKLLLNFFEEGSKKK